jgi:hypothetical protein
MLVTTRRGPLFTQPPRRPTQSFAVPSTLRQGPLLLLLLSNILTLTLNFLTISTQKFMLSHELLIMGWYQKKL